MGRTNKRIKKNLSLFFIISYKLTILKKLWATTNENYFGNFFLVLTKNGDDKEYYCNLYIFNTFNRYV